MLESLFLFTQQYTKEIEMAFDAFAPLRQLNLSTVYDTERMKTKYRVENSLFYDINKSIVLRELMLGVD